MKTKSTGSGRISYKIVSKAKPFPKNLEVKNSKTVIDLVPSMLKLNSILVPIDFSEMSKKALKYAVPFAQQFGAKLIFLYVLEPYFYPEDPNIGPFLLSHERLIKVSKEKLNDLVKQTTDPKLLGKVIVRVGQPYQEISDLAKKLKVDLIVITTHGYTGFKHVFMGSTAERVVRHAPCPVLTVREREHEFV